MPYLALWKLTSMSPKRRAKASCWAGVIPDHDDPAPVERGLDLGEGSLIEPCGQIDAGDLGGRGRAECPHSDVFASHGGRTSLPVFAR
jgi:hypothetical protein